MLGGGTNGNSIFPGFVDENSVQYDNNSLPQLQLFAHLNYPGSGCAPADDLPLSRVREGETLPVQQKVHMLLNNRFFQDENGGLFGNVLNPNHVSTGLKLSCDADEHNLSVSIADKTKKSNLAAMASINSVVQTEIDRQTQEFLQYIKIQEENILNGVREMYRRHMVSLLTALEKGVSKKLQEKEIEIEGMNRKNKELEERIKQVTMEAQLWHSRAKYNESVVNVLKSNIEQLMAREGCGDSEVDDAVSCSSTGNQGLQNYLPPKCRACNSKDVSVLMLPCRHLSLCVDCEGFIEVCPVCQVMKTESVHVYI